MASRSKNAAAGTCISVPTLRIDALAGIDELEEAKADRACRGSLVTGAGEVQVVVMLHFRAYDNLVEQVLAARVLKVDRDDGPERGA